MTDHYDVIVIGTGAGGGTLAHTLAPSGKRILLLERGDFLPRETQNWEPEPVFVDGRYISPDTWYDADGTPFQPQVHYFVGGATKLYGAALYRLRPAGLRRDQARRRRLAGVAGRATTTSSPGTRRPSGSTRCTATTARIRPRGTGRSSTRGRRCRTSRGSRRSSDDLAAAGYHPFSAPCGILLDEADRAREHVHPLHVVRRLPVPRARQVRRRDDRRAARCSTPPTSRCSSDAEVVKLETDAAGASVTGVVVSRDGEQRGLRGRHRRRVGRARRTAPSCCSVGERPPPERPGERLRPGRPELHVPQLQGRRRAGQGAQRHRLPEDARHQRLLLRGATTTRGRSATSRWSANRTAGR